jgi:phospholipase C
LNKHYREMSFFAGDIKDQSLPEYTFIEPLYDIGNNYQNGNSMHPLNDVRKGEQLVKQVYETLRNSPYWNTTMLVILFDEHGGFYDHASPPQAVPPGDGMNYANTKFAFDRLGVRVPAIVISAYTQQGMVIGKDAAGSPIIFDHTSVLATVEKKFGLKPLTKRDAAARTLELAVNLKNPRTTPADAPTSLPSPAAESLLKSVRRFLAKPPAAAADEAPLSTNQKSFLALALACDLEMSDKSKHEEIKKRHDAIKGQKDAENYLQEVDTKVRARRRKVQ